MPLLRNILFAKVILVATLAIVSSCSNQHPIFGQTISSAYEAPLTLADDPGRLYGEYIVSLEVGYTFEEHFARIGTQEHVKDRYEVLPYDAYYSAGVNDDLLAAIRADPGVQEVMCNRRKRIVWE